jgi:thiol-disulfide isomerase/thioredoxin
MMNALLLSITLLATAQDGSIPVGRWVSVDEIKLTKPLPPAIDEPATTDANVVAIDVPVSYYVVMFTADWCGPCQKWKREELPKLTAAGIKVEMIDIDRNKATARQFGVNTVPAFQVATVVGRKLALPSKTNQLSHYGNVGASFLLSKIAGLKPPSKTTEPKSLKQLIAEDMLKPSQEWYYEGQGTMYDHCVWHGWPRDEVLKLTLAEVTRLHAATHEGRLTP